MLYVSFLSSFSLSCESFFLGGIFRVTPLQSNTSNILKPLSAIIESPGSNFSRSPDSMKSCLSDMDPPYIGENKENAPDGVMPAKTFTVLWFL